MTCVRIGLAHSLLFIIGMMSLEHPQPTEPNLHDWLSVVHTFIQQRREEKGVLPKPKRNRERERARREARILFRDYEHDRATAQADESSTHLA